MNRDIYPYIQRHRALNSGLHVFPPTDFLPRPDGSSHSFYLKVTEGFPCAGHDSKYKDGTVNETDRASCTDWPGGSGKRWERKWVNNKQ